MIMTYPKLKNWFLSNRESIPKTLETDFAIYHNVWLTIENHIATIDYQIKRYGDKLTNVRRASEKHLRDLYCIIQK